MKGRRDFATAVLHQLPPPVRLAPRILPILIRHANVDFPVEAAETTEGRIAVFGGEGR
jgi:hypothetical protein